MWWEPWEKQKKENGNAFDRTSEASEQNDQTFIKASVYIQKRMQDYGKGSWLRRNVPFQWKGMGRNRTVVKEESH